MSHSDFFLVSPSYAEAGALESLPPTDGLQLLKNHDIENSELQFGKNDLVCITSEASIELVKNRFQDAARKEAIASLKDKYRFRNVLKSIYPDYVFEKVNLDRLNAVNINRKSVLKPAKGCFGTAVKTVDANTDLEGLVDEIEAELQKNASVLSSEVLSSNTFIIEGFIEGEEYAVDMFYDAEGKPHIVNIYHHPMPANEAYLHMIYYTSKEVFDLIYPKAMDFFEALNDKLQVRNFVMHCEFRSDSANFQPIEINSMRFGGMGLGNMVYYTMGVNPYELFRKGESPDWNTFWNSPEHSNNIYTYFIAYNGTDVDTRTSKPNIEKLKEEFTEVIYEQQFDYQKQLAFGVFTLNESPENLKKLLQIEFNDFFEPI